MNDQALPADQVWALAGVNPGSPERQARKSRGGEGTLMLSLDDEFSLESAQRLVSLIDGERRLLFFDGDHPQRSDPGLYCHLQRSDGQLFAKGANHGWGYPWLKISDISAARWLLLCVSHNDGSDHESSGMRIQRAVPIDADGLVGDDPYRRKFAEWLAARMA